MLRPFHHRPPPLPLLGDSATISSDAWASEAQDGLLDTPRSTAGGLCSSESESIAAELRLLDQLCNSNNHLPYSGLSAKDSFLPPYRESDDDLTNLSHSSPSISTSELSAPSTNVQPLSLPYDTLLPMHSRPPSLANSGNKRAAIEGSAFMAGSHVQVQDGWFTVVHLAAYKGHERIINILMDRGRINPNVADDYGRTPLVYAIVSDHRSITERLLAYGAKVEEPDCAGRSALHWAVLYQREELLQVLLEFCQRQGQSRGQSQGRRQARCIINASDGAGRTALSLAVELGFERGVLLLVDHGASIAVKA